MKIKKNENLVCANFAHTGNDGKKYKVKFYNLDAIIAVGYRVNSKNATKFRIWATKVLHEYLVNGYLSIPNESLFDEVNELKGLNDAISIIRSSKLSGTLKGKLTLKLTKNLK